MPSPTLTGTAAVAPDAVAGIALVPSPVVTAIQNATVTPTTVAAIAAVPAPTVVATEVGTATPDTVAAVVAVPAPAPSGDANVLARVTGLIATMVSSTEIDLTWTAVSGAGGYDIERDGAVFEFDHPDTAYEDTGLDPDTTYRYRVRAVP